MNQLPLTRRHLMQAALMAAGATSGLTANSQTVSSRKPSRNTDTVRLGWGRGGLTLLAKVRGPGFPTFVLEDRQGQLHILQTGDYLGKAVLWQEKLRGYVTAQQSF